MRELKFRAWVIPKRDEDLPIDPTPYMAIQGEPDLETLSSFMFHYGNQEHLMQFVGLKDKNGIEIYEDDVLKDDEGRVWRIVWSEGKGGFVIQKQEEKKKFDGRLGPLTTSAQAYIIKMMEKIGDAFQNPELLKP